MEALAALAVAALGAWAYLAGLHGGFWRTDQRLPPVAGEPGPPGEPAKAADLAGAPGGAGTVGGEAAPPSATASDPAVWPEVVAVVPARDEAGMLPLTLPSLLAQDYPGELRVVLVDDQSGDGTAETATRIGEGAGTVRPLQVVRGSEPPAGWAGKVWAMARGAAEAGRPAYLLFTDADVEHAPWSLRALVRAAEADRRDLVSRMALLRARSGWERAVVPAFVYFFAMLYPFRRVNRAGARTAAAAGGCMLVRREALEAAGGLERIRGARIDDVALGRLLKRRAGGGRVWLGLATEVVSRREYPRLADLWAMVARSAYTQLRHSPPLLAATVAGLLWLFVVPPLAAVAGTAGLALGPGGPGGAAAAWAAGAGLGGWALMAVTYLPMVRLYRLGALRALTLPLVAVLYAGMTVDSARRHHAGRGAFWKGRPAPRRQRTTA